MPRDTEPCGVYGYPPELAAPVAIGAVRGHDLELVRFVLLGEETLEAFRAVL